MSVRDLDSGRLDCHDSEDGVTNLRQSKSAQCDDREQHAGLLDSRLHDCVYLYFINYKISDFRISYLCLTISFSLI